MLRQQLEQQKYQQALVWLLLVLFWGPIIAPLFQATQTSPLFELGGFARQTLATYICPTPAKSYQVLGYDMAVCVRCWAGTIGLWLAWWQYRRPNALLYRFLALPVWQGLLIVISAMLLWRLEISVWPQAPYWLLLLNGIWGGYWVALFLFGLFLKPRSQAISVWQN